MTTSIKKSERRIRQYIYNQLAVMEMKSNDNRYFAGQILGKNPSDEEAAIYYTEHAATDFAERFGFILNSELSLVEIYQRLADLKINKNILQRIISSPIH